MEESPLQIDSRISCKLANMALVCALFVVALHSPGVRGFLGIDLLADGLLLIAVPYFFVASGFLLAGHMNSSVGGGWLLPELRKRMQTLLIPYFLWNLSWMAFMFLWTFLMNVYHGNDLLLNLDNVLIDGVLMRSHSGPRPLECLPRDVVSAVGLDPFRLPFVQQLWYVRALLVLIVVSPLLKRLANIKGLVFLWLAYMFLRPWGGPSNVGGYPLANLFHNVYLNSFFRICLSAEGLFYFTCGIYLRFHPKSLTQRGFLACLGVGIALLCIYGYCDSRSIVRGVKYLRMFALPFLLVAIWYATPSGSWPKWLVAQAFPIFLCHRCVLFLMTNIAHITSSVWLLNVVVAAVLSITVVLLIRRFAPKVATLYFGGR